MLDTETILVRSLLAEKMVDEVQVERAKRHASQHGMKLGEALSALGIVKPKSLAIARAAISERPFVDLEAFDIDIRNASLLPRSVAERLGAFPLFALGGVVTVGMVDPLNLRAVDQARQALRADVEPALCEPEPLRALIARAYSLSTAGGAPSTERDTARDLTTGEEPIVAAVNQILAQAIEEHASDVHVGPDEQEMHLRYRIDGRLVAKQGPALSAHAGIVQRLKVMAGLDLTQTRKPQDGKFRFERRGETVDVRVSIVPTVCGENVVMRLLRPHAAIAGFGQLGLSSQDRWTLEGALDKPHGMILVTGPTGAGKTTTLYAALAKVNTPERNVMTIEDPVEIRLPMVRQTQVNAEIGLTFASALRSILRQDPDVALVGEIRDQETAQIAVQAALTGHLVLSTLHTNDAVGAVARLRDLGVPPFAIASSLLCVIGQRLVRRVCEGCAATVSPSDALLRRTGLDRASAMGFRRGAGCARCLARGHRGRLGVYEVMPVTPEVRRAIEADAGATEITRAAEAAGLRPLWKDALDKAMQGQTTDEEALSLMAEVEVEALAEREQRTGRQREAA